MHNERITAILEHKSSLDHIPLRRIERLVFNHVSKCSLLARIDFLSLLAACQGSSDLWCLYRGLCYIILRLKCARFIRLTAV